MGRDVCKLTTAGPQGRESLFIQYFMEKEVLKVAGLLWMRAEPGGAPMPTTGIGQMDWASHRMEYGVTFKNGIF